MKKAKPESQVLAEVLDSTRDLTKWYLSLLKKVDSEKTFKANGIPLNSALWVAAHMVQSEHRLLVEGLGVKPLSAPWMKNFGIGSKPLPPGKGPTFKDVLVKMDAVHRAALKAVKSLKEADLDQPNAMGFKFGGKDTRRNLIHHAIRHEGCHAGHLGWICKLNGIKTV
jgi:uncharacterized damage-inducible protein DinB